MRDYYAQQLNSDKLFAVYDTDIPRIARYLKAEIDCIISRVDKSFTVLELGAGYGRIMKELAPHVKRVDGIDIAESSVAFGQEYLKNTPNARLYHADAMSFAAGEKYNAVICAQNGLSSIKGDPGCLIQKAVGLLEVGGTALFSTYSGKFWAYRLAWFQEQADKGLLGELDFAKSVNGKIICKDGFTATSFTEQDLRSLGKRAGKPFSVEEVDRSSLFLTIYNI